MRIFKPTLFKILLLAVAMPAILLIPLHSSSAQGATNKPTSILLVYDSLANGTSKEGNVEALQRMLASYGVQVSLMPLDTYVSGTLQQYKRAIRINNTIDIADSNWEYLADFQSYQGNYLHIGGVPPRKLQEKLKLETITSGQDTLKLSIGALSQASIQVQQQLYIKQSAGTAIGSMKSTSLKLNAFPFGVNHDGYAYVPYYEKGNLSELAMAYVLKDWLGIESHSNNYLLINEVYPFSNLALLEELADKLYEAGIPFIVSARPVLSNLDYPAAKRYMETLKYVQSRNGSIVVNAPAVASTISDIDRDLNAALGDFIDALADYDIAPLGMGAEMYWSYDRYYVDKGMEFFDSVILFPNERLMYKSKIDTSQSYSSSLFSVASDYMQPYEHTGKVIEPLPMDIAVTVPFVEDESELEELASRLISSWTIFSDYKHGSHSVVTKNNTITSENGLLLINGRSVTLNDAKKSISSEYAYGQEEQKSFENFFAVQNRFFIIIIVVTIMAFGVFLIVGYRMYRRKYFK